MNEQRRSGPNGQGTFGSLYGFVLRFCPRDFREQYGADLLATVTAREADWTGLGWATRQRQRVQELRALLSSVYGMRVPAVEPAVPPTDRPAPPGRAV